MRKIGGMRWALILGLSLALIASGAAIVGSTAAPARVTTQELGAGDEVSMEAWPGAQTLSNELAREFPQDDSGNVTIALVARWGYLDDPAVMAMAGRWRFNDTGTGGEFAGDWHLLGRRIGGTLHGRFTLPPDGRGEFRGHWEVSGGREGGSLWGSWTRDNDTHGSFAGSWDFSSGRDGGALAGRWIQVDRESGGFRGHAVAAPSIAPVDWDGAVKTESGVVHVARTLRFERNDQILPRNDRQTVEWTSTTTVNWDGIVFVLRIPRADADANVTLRTAQVGFTWTVRELPGLHVRQQVDRAGHAIEVAGFVLGRHPDHDYVRFEIGMRWGNLSAPNGPDPEARDVTTWNGFAQITYGGLAVERVLSFERGDEVLPRENRATIVWHSSTTSGWDGLVITALVPAAHAGDTYFTLHAGPFTQVFTLRELPGDHVFDAGNGGMVEVRAVRG